MHVDADGDGFISRAELDRMDFILTGSSHDGGWQEALRSCKDRAVDGEVPSSSHLLGLTCLVQLSCRGFVHTWLACGCQQDHCETVLKALLVNQNLLPTLDIVLLDISSPLFANSRGICAFCHQPVLESQLRLRLEASDGSRHGGYIHRECSEWSGLAANVTQQPCGDRCSERTQGN